ncbi:MAG TPA: hypothetical protein VFB49_05065 [Patescibacteria group bacterium]|nr:hypothetical protein [Patescibacteria group bacterium]
MRPIGRLAHPPFRVPAPEDVSIAATAARLLSAGSNGRGTGVVGSRRGAPDAGSPGRTLEAAVFAVLLDAPLVVATVEPFRDLVRVSAWSMNAPGRPPDGVLARHLGIAERATDGFRPLAASALDALLAGDGPAVAASLRARRRAAKADGPPRFKLLAAKSAGLRPLVLYVDLLPALAAGGEKASAWLGTLERGQAEALLGISIALFI